MYSNQQKNNGPYRFQQRSSSTKKDAYEDDYKDEELDHLEDSYGDEDIYGHEVDLLLSSEQANKQQPMFMGKNLNEVNTFNINSGYKGE